MLVVSHVLPLPGRAGQEMRVLNKLLAFRERFEVSFLTFAKKANIQSVRSQLEEIVPRAIVLPSLTQSNLFARTMNKLRARRFVAQTGLKESNYVIGEVELSPERVRNAIKDERFDLAVYEYWHAHQSVPALQAQGIRCVLDMHDLLWQSFKRSVENIPGLTETQRASRVAKYKAAEERAWKTFDAIIAINRAEQDYLRAFDPGIKTFYAAMGTNLEQWSYQWAPASPPRLAYYGGLGNIYNQKDAMICYEHIMPAVWERYPDAELWITGSGPPEHLKALADGKRVFVPGFVDKVQDVLKTMSIVLCPFNGTFGFRSRLIEVMALGVPVVASEDAAYGMDLPSGEGIFLTPTVEGITEHALRLLGDSEALHTQSTLARAKVEELYSFKQTYGRLADELLTYVEGEKQHE